MADSFFVLGLNHASLHFPVTLAHFIDIDALQDCLPEIVHTARWVVMPWHPHRRFIPTRKTLQSYASEIPELALLESEGRLLTYNFCSADQMDGFEEAPRIEAVFFSAEAGLNVLASIGARKVRSLGIDGGTDYSSQFRNLEGKTKLANGHTTFDLQFASIARTIRRTGIDYAPLYVDAPIRVYAAACADERLPLRMLDFSIKKHASMSTEFHAISLNQHQRGGIGFRNWISEFWKVAAPQDGGRAICFAAGTQVSADLSEIWTQSVGGAAVAYPGPDDADSHKDGSPLLLNCSQGSLTAAALPSPSECRPELDASWHHVDEFVPGVTKAVHFADAARHPWKSPEHPCGSLWWNDLDEALSEGFVTPEMISEEIDSGHVAPALLQWIAALREPAETRLQRVQTALERVLSPLVRSDRGRFDTM